MIDGFFSLNLDQPGPRWCFGLILSLSGWLAARKAAGAFTRSSIPYLFLDLAPVLGWFAWFSLFSGRAILSGILVFAMGAFIALIDTTKRLVLRESLIFSDIAEFEELIRHPDLYIPFAGTGLVVSGLIAAFVAVLTLGYWERPIPGFGWATTLGAVALIFVFRQLWGNHRIVSAIARHMKRWNPRYDPAGDAKRFGPFACHTIYAMIARAERPERQRAAETPCVGNAADAHPSPMAEPLSPVPSGPIILVQSESFFDPRRLPLDLPSDLLPAFDHCRSDGGQNGFLEVTAWGANTMRTEFAALTGLHDEALGYDRYNPYHGFAKHPIHSLAKSLKAHGYETICVHPFDPLFFHRHKILPLLGFDQFITESAFKHAKRAGKYVSDPAIADYLLSLISKRNHKIFIFVITMQNHGPWPTSTSAVPAPHGLSADHWPLLHSYLDGLKDSDAMLGQLHQALKAGHDHATLGFYGDHMPSLPQIFDALNFDDPRPDYLIWSKTADSVRSITLPAHDLLSALETTHGINPSQHRSPSVVC